MERRRKQVNSTHKNSNNPVEDLVRNAENEYPVPDPNKTIIHMTNDIHKNSLKEEIMNDLIKILMEKLQEKVKQNIRDVLKQYQGTTNKKHEKAQKKLAELREDFNKLKSERKETIKNTYIKCKRQNKI
jgi:esterase/lipase